MTTSLTRTPEERAQRLASWYEKFPKTLTLDNPPARFREINVEHRRLTPLYALGWHISIGKLVEHLRHGSESQKGRNMNQRITDRWLRKTLHEGYKPIFIKAPGFLPSPGTDDSSGILYLFFNNAEQERRRIFEENKEAVIGEMITFMGFDSEMKEKVAWHQGPVKGLTSW